MSERKKKGGRPKSKNPKRKMIFIRVTDGDFKSLSRLADEEELTISEMVRGWIKTRLKRAG